VYKKSITNSQPFVKKMKKMSGFLGGDFFDSHCRMLQSAEVCACVSKHNKKPSCR